MHVADTSRCWKACAYKRIESKRASTQGKWPRPSKLAFWTYLPSHSRCFGVEVNPGRILALYVSPFYGPVDPDAGQPSVGPIIILRGETRRRSGVPLGGVQVSLKLVIVGYSRETIACVQVFSKLKFWRGVKGKAIDFTSHRTSSGQASWPYETVPNGTILSPSEGGRKRQGENHQTLAVKGERHPTCSSESESNPGCSGERWTCYQGTSKPLGTSSSHTLIFHFHVCL